MQTFEEFADYILSNANHNQKNPHKRVHIIVDYPQLEFGDFYKYLMTLTWQSGIPWNKGVNAKSHNVIFAKTLDEACNKADEYDNAIVSYVGTVFRRGQFHGDKTVYDYFEDFCNQDVWPVKGHILWHPGRQYGRLHQQTMFLNLEHGRKIGRPSFGNYTGRVQWPIRDEDNVHDDYTPWFLNPGEKYVDVKNAEMAEYISAVLEDDKRIENFTPMERSTKYFTYPQREDISPQLINDQNTHSDITYIVNNQSFKPILKTIADRKFDVIYAPASGNIAEFLWSNFGHKDTKLVILDYHKPSCTLKRMHYINNNLGHRVSNIDEAQRMLYFLQRMYPNTHLDNCDYKPELVEANEEIFSNEQWFKTIKDIKHIDIKQFDFIKDTLEVDSTKSNLIYTSNIFSYWKMFHEYSLEQLTEKFNYLLALPNTTVYGQSPYRENIFSENNLR